MIRIPAPAALNGDALTAELRAAALPGAFVVLHPDAGEIEVHGVKDFQRAEVERVARAHVPPPAPADPQAEFRKAVSAATTLAALKDALLGTTGPGAEPRQPTKP